MKKNLIWGLLIVQFSLAAQPVQSIQPTLSSITEVVVLAENKNFNVIFLEFGLMTTAPVSVLISLKDLTMHNVGVLTDHAEDVDLEVYKQLSDSTFALVDLDRTIQPIASVEFSPTAPALYKFVLKCPKLKPTFDFSHYGLILYRK